MRKLCVLTVVALATSLAGAGPSAANGSGTGGMGDPSAHMRYMQAICQAQRDGTYPRYHNACLPDDLPQPPSDRR